MPSRSDLRPLLDFVRPALDLLVPAPAQRRDTALACALTCALGALAPLAHAADAGADPATTASEAAQPPVADGSDAIGLRWALTIDAPSELTALLTRYLDLSRYQRSEDQGAITRGELSRLLSVTPAQVRRLLETEGYFDAQVRTELPPDWAEADANRMVQVRLVVQPGPRARVASVALEVSGALALAADGGDEAARALRDRLQAAWALPAGHAFTQGDWGDAKNALLTLLRTEGYAAASISHSLASVDATRHRVTVALMIDSGPLFHFGDVSFEGLDHVRRDAVMPLRAFRDGEPLREQQLLNFQERMVKTNLFDSVTVTYDPDPERAAATPITVRVRERVLQQATFGVGWSDATGPRVTVEHVHQQLLGWGWQSKSKFQLGQTSSSASVDLLSHPHPGPYRNLIAGKLSQTEASGLRVTSESLSMGRTQDTERVERTYYLKLERAFTRDTGTNAITDDTSAASLHYEWVWRQLDHPILPTTGYSLSASVAGGHSFAATQSDGWFGRGSARLTGYWMPGENWYGQARVEFGQIAARRSVAVPYTMLFRAGGDDSVRGYSYQSLGPDDSDGTAVGARLLATASLELARPFRLSAPAWWGAVFVDAGNAAADWNTYKPALGYGVGVRWRSPVGPLRIDLAYGEQTRRMRLHFTVGITF